jgi:hypothetical protein
VWRELGPKSVRILRMLADREPRTVDELRFTCDISDHANALRTIRTLAFQGFVTVLDAQPRQVQLTPEGRSRILGETGQLYVNPQSPEMMSRADITRELHEIERNFSTLTRRKKSLLIKLRERAPRGRKA